VGFFFTANLSDSNAITCENFLPKSFRIRKLCNVKVVAKNAGKAG